MESKEELEDIYTLLRSLNGEEIQEVLSFFGSELLCSIGIFIFKILISRMETLQ